VFAVGLIASCLAALGLGEIQDSAAIVTVSGAAGDRSLTQQTSD